MQVHEGKEMEREPDQMAEEMVGKEGNEENDTELGEALNGDK